MTAQPTLADRSASFPCDVGDVAGYRRAVRAPLGITVAADGHASPLHPFVLAHPRFEQVVEGFSTQSAPARPIHLSQELTMSRLVRGGEQVTVTIEVPGARREPRGVRVALRGLLTGADGAPVAELATAVLLAGAVTPEPFGTIPARPAPRPPGPVIGQTTLRHAISLDSVRRYAAASGDRNPIHLDPQAARQAGFPGVIVHGMSLLALVCEEVIDRYGDGDPTRIQGIGCRFSSPVSPAAAIATTLADHGGVVRFSSATDQGTALKSGWVALTTAGWERSG